MFKWWSCKVYHNFSLIETCDSFFESIVYSLWIFKYSQKSFFSAQRKQLLEVWNFASILICYLNQLLGKCAFWIWIANVLKKSLFFLFEKKKISDWSCENWLIFDSFKVFIIIFLRQTCHFKLWPGDIENSIYRDVCAHSCNFKRFHSYQRETIVDFDGRCVIFKVQMNFQKTKKKKIRLNKTIHTITQLKI